jgi:hypothetical protein
MPEIDPFVNPIADKRTVVFSPFFLAPSLTGEPLHLSASPYEGGSSLLGHALVLTRLINMVIFLFFYYSFYIRHTLVLQKADKLINMV